MLIEKHSNANRQRPEGVSSDSEENMPQPQNVSSDSVENMQQPEHVSSDSEEEEKNILLEEEDNYAGVLNTQLLHMFTPPIDQEEEIGIHTINTGRSFHGFKG